MSDVTYIPSVVWFDVEHVDIEHFLRVLGEIATWETTPMLVLRQTSGEPAQWIHYLDQGQTTFGQARWGLQCPGTLLDPTTLESLLGRCDVIVLDYFTEEDFDSFSDTLDEIDLNYTPSRHPFRILAPHGVEPASDPHPSRTVLHFNQHFDAPDVPKAGQQPCHELWHHLVLGPHYNLYPCFRDTSFTHSIGATPEKPLLQSFNDVTVNAMRSTMQRGQRATINMCRHCPQQSLKTIRPVVGWTDPQPTDSDMPWGSYNFIEARHLARVRGHICLPAPLIGPYEYEYVVGLTPDLTRQAIDIIQHTTGSALVAIWVAGSRVMTRPRLQQLDPSIFHGVPGGTLRVGNKPLLREYGRDVRRSSDLDLKVFVEATWLEAQDPNTLEQTLGQALHELGAPFPFSGHPDPRLRLHPVPDATPSAATAFRHYNQTRQPPAGKGLLSEYAALLLFDPRGETPPLDGSTPELPKEFWAATETELPIEHIPMQPHTLADTHLGLSVHRWEMLMRDQPRRFPAGIKRNGDGSAAVYAAKRAGRKVIWVED